MPAKWIWKICLLLHYSSYCNICNGAEIYVILKYDRWVVCTNIYFIQFIFHSVIYLFCEKKYDCMHIYKKIIFVMKNKLKQHVRTQSKLVVVVVDCSCNIFDWSYSFDSSPSISNIIPVTFKIFCIINLFTFLH